MRAFSKTLLSLVLLLAPVGLLAQDKPPAYDVREHYTKYEYRIPMRDGVRLFTAVYVPKNQSQKWPFLFNRTPYGIGPYGVENYPQRLATLELMQAGYIFVNQDVRGRNMSEGKFVEESPYKDNKGPKDTDETTDMYDSIDFLLKTLPDKK